MLALFVALPSGSYAAATALAPRNSVGSAQVINGSLKKADLSWENIDVIIHADDSVFVGWRLGHSVLFPFQFRNAHGAFHQFTARLPIAIGRHQAAAGMV